MDIRQFLSESYTAYHATKNICDYLNEQGFVQLTLGQKWNLQIGGKYYIARNGSSVVAFRIGKNKIFHICESHTDSPAFKIKGGSIVERHNVTRLNTEKYGGVMMYSYFDRPMKIAGRVLVETENGVKHEVVTSPYNVVIPSLAIHYNPDANDGFPISAQRDTLPLFSQNPADLYKSLTDKNVVDADLYVVPDTPAFYAGVNGEFLCSPRIDDLTSVYTSIHALAEADCPNVSIVACLDNEEIGATTRQGAPDFLNVILKQICSQLGWSKLEATAAREQGMILSIDNGQAIHPAHPEKSDPVVPTYMNRGIVVKHSAKYATDGLSSAIFKHIAKQHNLPVQDCYNNSDVRGGSTLGLVTSCHLGMKTCDIGLSQLAMHSACETIGAKDIATMQQAIKCFLSAELQVKGHEIHIKVK